MSRFGLGASGFREKGRELMAEGRGCLVSQPKPEG